MAATDQTFRNQRILHIVFGATSLAMFLSVILMMVQDYNKEFKPIQRKFRDVEVGINERLMLDQLPDADEVKQKMQEVADARTALENKKKDLSGVESTLAARREKLDTAYRMKKAEFDSKMSYLDIAVEKVGKAATESERKAREQEVQQRRDELEKRGGVRDELDVAKTELDAVDKEHHEEVFNELEPYQKRLSDAEDSMKRVSGVCDRFGKTTAQKTWKFSDTFRELPILDAFSSPVRVQQTKLNDLTIDYGGFRDVPRFDRCTTCHLGIDRGTFDRASLTALNSVPENLAKKLDTAHELFAQRVKSREDLGFDPNEIPRTPTVVKLTRGEITQYMAHPRLDLFVDANSPHPMQRFGCTICHAGQGSSTEFILASHTPNDSHQEEEWKKEHDWESVHFWDFPMYPNRFLESGCVKCHHEMTDLVRYGVKEEAPELLRGYNLVRENGCFGCHEIAGMKSGRSVGPDLRLEPAPALEWLSPAEQERVKADIPGNLRKVGPSLRRIAEKTNEDWTRKWIKSPRGFRPDTKMPHFFGLSTNNKDYLGKNAPEQVNFPDAEIHSIAHYLFLESSRALEGKDTGRLFLVKSMEELQKKLATAGLSDAKRKDLTDFTHNFASLALLTVPAKANEINGHLEEQKKLQDELFELQKPLYDSLKKLDDELADFMVREQDETKRKEKQDEINNKKQDEITRAAPKTEVQRKRLAEVTKALIESSTPTPIAKGLVDWEGNAAATDLAPGDLVNGRRLFSEKGCLACHSHDATATADAANKIGKVDGQANFGPNLSRLAAKLGARYEKGKIDPAAKQWLVQWILNPNLHHPRTRMPVTFLTPGDANDVAQWLLSQPADYDDKGPDKPAHETLVALARVYLGKVKDMTQEDVDTILPEKDNPNSEKVEKRMKLVAPDADEQVLRGGDIDDGKLQWYIGRKSITRLGCFGCHDLPGFENAKPVGTALNDWGKKDPERLAFEDASAFVKEHFNIVPLRDPAKELELRATVKRLTDKESSGKLSDAEEAELKTARDATERMKWERKDGRLPYDTYFAERLEHHRREGFLNQKLIEPRSYDYGRTRSWDDRLRMPQFQFARSRRHANEAEEDYDARQLVEEAEAREAVMTFILGLVAEPVPLRYVNKPTGDRHAEVKGRQVLEKYNCVGCHLVRPGRYEFKKPAEPVEVEPGRYEFKKSPEVYQQLAASLATAKNSRNGDYNFHDHNAWTAKPSSLPDRYVAYGVEPRPAEDDANVLSVRFAEAFSFNGPDGVTREIRASSGVLIPQDALLSRDDELGGTFAELMPTYLFAKDRVRFDNRANALSALPPPLVREGERVQPRWLYQFLQNPTPIRPQNHMVLRMPRFNMSPDEAMAIVNYFGAVSRAGNPDDNLTFPYLKVEQRENGYWRQKSKEYVKRLEDAKLLDSRLKQLEPVWKEQLQEEKAELDQTRDRLKRAIDAMKKAIDAEKAGTEKEIKQKSLMVLEEDQKKVNDRLPKVTDQLAKNDFGPQRDQWKDDAYAVDAYRQLLNKDMCINCHSIGKVEIPSPTGPNLDLTAARLRPEWTKYWLANPNRMFTYSTKMPQNFGNEKKADTKNLDFIGEPLDQVKAVRDALMDLNRLADMPVNRLRATTPAEGGK